MWIFGSNNWNKNALHFLNSWCPPLLPKMVESVTKIKLPLLLNRPWLNRNLGNGNIELFRCGNPDYGDALHGVAKPNLTYWVELYPETTLLQAADVDQILQKAADQEQEEIRK
jgi:hypothetical protein